MASIQERLNNAGIGEDRAYYTFHDTQRVAAWAGSQATEVLAELGLHRERGYFTRHDVLRAAKRALEVAESRVIDQHADPATAQVVRDVPAYLYDQYAEETVIETTTEDVA
ncbi:MAG TPA: hypothetical protein VN031_02840 [Candidatus Microsaccharimonas sp.]|nr:hypothetical protein [Candidatus Microsaccharimonas sp.]